MSESELARERMEHQRTAGYRDDWQRRAVHVANELEEAQAEIQVLRGKLENEQRAHKRCQDALRNRGEELEWEHEGLDSEPRHAYDWRREHVSVYPGASHHPDSWVIYEPAVPDIETGKELAELLVAVTRAYLEGKHA